MPALNVAIIVFNGVETLDFCGPLEVFSAANIASEQQFFNVYTFAADTSPITTINGLSVNPRFGFEDLPDPDILVIPGGEGSRSVITNPNVLRFVELLYHKSQYTFSVCSGARILAVLGLLDGKKFTTHHSVFDDVQMLAPKAFVRPNNRFTDNGKILTSAGVAAGIDLSFYLLEKIKGKEIAQLTARYMEYPLAQSNISDYKDQ